MTDGIVVALAEEDPPGLLLRVWSGWSGWFWLVSLIRESLRHRAEGMCS